ncbi:MAG: LuxR C-terminal-related transcriptional regulator [Aeromicrobium sp.]
MTEAVGTTLGRIAASADPMPCRALALLVALRTAVPFDAAWLASSGPANSIHVSLASLDLDDEIDEFLNGTAVAQDLAVASSDGSRPLGGRSEPSYPSSDQPLAWSAWLAPAGMHASLSVALVTRGGRHVGFLVLLFRRRELSLRTTRRRLATLAPTLATGHETNPGHHAPPRVGTGVTAGTVLRDDGVIEALPGLHGDPLLAAGSPVLTFASRLLDDGLVYSSFLWPLGGSFAPDGHARITVVAAPEDGPADLTGMALVSPAPDLHGLTPRELEVLGLVIDGCSNQEIARALVVAPRTVAAHIEHLLVKLDVRTRTAAAVRAEREGLYVPA